MGVFTIQTPDGRKLDIDANDAHGAIAGAQDWVSKNPPVPVNVAGEVAAPFAGFNKGIDATINLPGTLGNLAAHGINAGAGMLGYDAPLPEQPFEPIRAATRFNSGYEPQTLAGRTGEAIGEVAGGAVAPEAGLMAKAASMTPQALKMAAPVLQRAATATTGQIARGLVAPTIGSGVGVQAAREADLGPIGEMAGGLLGGFALPNAANMAARTYGGAKAGMDFANRQVQRAKNPEPAAFQDIADLMVKSKLDPTETFQDVAPKISPQSDLNRRINPKTGSSFLGEDMADIVSRRLQGEHPDDIGADYGVSGPTVQRYVDNWQAANPTPRNLIDIAKEKLGSGGAAPLSDRARTDMAISNDPVAADRLVRRQMEQPGRTADIIEQSSVEGRNLSQELDRLSTQGKAEERAAYEAVHKNEQPIDISNVVVGARQRALQRGGEIGGKINEALDKFFKPVAQPKRISAMDDVRMKEMRERIDAAKSKGVAPERIAMLERRFDAMRDDFEYAQNAKPEIVKPGKPISSVREFIDARDELSQMTKMSMKDGQSTPLTAELTKLREGLNTAARSTNKALSAADAKYSGNRSVERMIENGSELGKKLTPKTKQGLREFGKLTPTQQEIQRVAFEDKMASEALNVKRGNAAADQFQSESFDRIVETLYPKTAGKEIYQRGQNLLKNLRRESISTETTRGILSGSRTAPLQNEIAATLEGVRAGADVLTGRFGKVLENLSNKLTRQIGGKAAEARIRILTETDPATLLQNLRRLAREAKDAETRQAYVIAIREFAKVPKSASAQAGVGIAVSRDRKPTEITIPRPASWPALPKNRLLGNQ